MFIKFECQGETSRQDRKFEWKWGVGGGGEKLEWKGGRRGNKMYYYSLKQKILYSCVVSEIVVWNGVLRHF